MVKVCSERKKVHTLRTHLAARLFLPRLAGLVSGALRMSAKMQSSERLT